MQQILDKTQMLWRCSFTKIWVFPYCRIY